MAQNQRQISAASKGIEVARVASTKVATKVVRVVSRVVPEAYRTAKSGPKPPRRSSGQSARRS